MPDFTRQELYDAVWAKSAVQLAKQIGVSDVAIAKACKKYEIPKPPLGYWARVQHGQKPKRPPLPKLQNPDRQVIRFEPVPAHLKPDPLSDETEQRVRSEKADDHRVIVPPVLENPHPLVERTQRSLLSAAPNEDGIVIPKAKNGLEVAVGKDSIDRSMRIMHALLTALTTRGMRVTTDGNAKWATLVYWNGETLALRLSESLGERPRELTTQQRQENERYRFLSPYPKTEKYPRGLLTITARGNDDEYIQKRWSELDGKRLEERLNPIIAWLYRAVEEIKSRRIEHAEQEKRWAEERRLREEAERQRWENERRLKAIEDQAAAWRRATAIREYVNAVEKGAESDGRADDALKERLRWARDQADRMDPLSTGRMTW